MKANAIRHQTEVKEASGFLKADEFLFFLDKSSAV